MSVRANATERRAAAGERTALMRAPPHPMNDKRRGTSAGPIIVGLPAAKGVGKQQKAILALSTAALVLMVRR